MEQKASKAKIIPVISVIALVAVIAAIVIIVKVVIPTNKSDKVITPENNDQYTEATTTSENPNALSIGDTFYYGSYKDRSLEWTVIDIQDTKVFVIATKAITQIPYNFTNEAVTWSSCDLRTWLNNDFINEAFTSEEQSKILTTTVNPGNNPQYTTDAGSATEDKIFLLSADEAEQYFSTDSSRVCDFNGNASAWWLRSPGNSQNYAVNVHRDGSIWYNGVDVDNAFDAVRPAMWINLEPKSIP